MTDDLDPKAIREAADVIWPLDDMPEHERDEALRIASRAIAAYKSKTAPPDRGEMAEREWRVLYGTGSVAPTPHGEDQARRVAEQGRRAGMPCRVQSREVGPWVDAALGPATDQEREGTDG